LGKAHIPFLFIIDFAMRCPVVIPLEQVNPNAILFAIRDKKNYTPIPSLTEKDIGWETRPVDFSCYSTAFHKVMHHLRSGNSFLVNLTFPTEVQTPLSLKEIFHLAEAKYKLWFKDQFVVFSPETFVQITNGEIASYPMKGTIDQSVPDAQEKLLHNTKEMAEHVTIVDLIRNDLSLFAHNVNVTKFRYVEEINTIGKTLLQVSSEIKGQLPAHYHEMIGDIIFTMLPAGSVSGAPKPKTLAIIREAETYDRGYYTGVFGIFDGNNLDSAVMIRFVEQAGHRLIYKSGGGITANSEVTSEYQEMIDKVYVPVNRKHPIIS
jgi:para-aminobenzoate synthetase component 1